MRYSPNCSYPSFSSILLLVRTPLHTHTHTHPYTLAHTHTHTHTHTTPFPWSCTSPLLTESCSNEERIPVQQFEREAEMMERYQLHMSSLRDKYNEIKESDRDFGPLLDLPGIEAKVTMGFLKVSVSVVTDMYCILHTHMPSPPHMHTHALSPSHAHTHMCRSPTCFLLLWHPPQVERYRWSVTDVEPSSMASGTATWTLTRILTSAPPASHVRSSLLTD